MEYSLCRIHYKIPIEQDPSVLRNKIVFSSLAIECRENNMLRNHLYYNEVINTEATVGVLAVVNG